MKCNQVSKLVRSTDPWRNTFYADAVGCPVAVQSPFSRNFELFYRTSPAFPGDGRVRHVYYDRACGLWNDATTFGPVDTGGHPESLRQRHLR